MDPTDEKKAASGTQDQDVRNRDPEGQDRTGAQDAGSRDPEGQDRTAPQNAGEFRVPVEYASPMKRLWAWVGLVYAVGYALLMAYAFARGDFPQGIGQLLIAPALAGLGASVILRYRQGKGHGGLPGRGGLPVCIGLSGVSFALALWNLIRGLPVLLGQL